MHLALADPASRTEATEIIRSLIARVDIHALEAAGFEIELIGEIARMIEVASGSGTQKTAPLGTVVRGLSERSVKVVAGTGFEPVTFRL